jgi:uncharacterized Ntn-hydrolase superfamily protein
MTFSLVARSADARLFGMTICSSSPAVAARCAHARAHIGAVASQNITDPALGTRILDSLAAGAPSDAALHGALAATPYAAYRQVLVVGKEGPPAVHSGDHALGIVALTAGKDAAAAGNLLANREVPRVMREAFEDSRAHSSRSDESPAQFAMRLLRALQAGAQQGGEAGPVHSAGLLIVRDLSWPIIDLRVDWSEDPVADLAAIWDIYAPQVEDYVRRALDPGAAPSFGVPGNL